MCGIWGIFGSDVDVHEQVPSCFKIAHRGPDCFRFENVNHFQNCAFGFHRLAIVDDLNGMQPIRVCSMPHIWMIYNGEIYNHKELGQKYDFNYLTKCDGEALIHLYNKGGIDFMAENLYGVFGFILFDANEKKVFIGRDSFGVRPVFKSFNEETGTLTICSEAKGLTNLKTKNITTTRIEALKPGTLQEYSLSGPQNTCKLVRETKFHAIGAMPKYDVDVNLTNDVYENIRTCLTNSVKKRLMAERRIGCLLSGGLDSSLICGLVVQEARKLGLTEKYPIQTFSIGMDDSSPDILAARKVAEMLKTEHHEILFNETDVQNALLPVIKTLETYDVTTIRASTPMYLLSKYINENTDTVVLFSGEGADEIGQGYAYFHKAPSAQAGHDESMRLCNDLYMFDVCRADRTTAAWGLELRVPFLDHFFTHFYFTIPMDERTAKGKERCEKHLIRKAFDNLNVIPNDILWRPKEAFSDGVANKKKSLFEIIQTYVDTLVSDEEFQSNSGKYVFNAPKTKEGYYFRKVFDENYANCEHFTPYIWLPKWCGDVVDPSARVLNFYDEQQKKTVE